MPEDIPPIDEELAEDQQILLIRLSRDLRAMAALMSPTQQRATVDLYYQVQEMRKRAVNQFRASQGEEPNGFVTMVSAYMTKLENIIVGALDACTDASPVGRWCKGQYGIGPVLTAGLAAYVNIEQCQTVSALVSFAGYNPDRRWIGADEATQIVQRLRTASPTATAEDLVPECSAIMHVRPEALQRMLQNQMAFRQKTAKEEGTTGSRRGRAAAVPTHEDLVRVVSKRPWNAKLKLLCFKLGDCFVKFHNHEKCVYGHVYAERKAAEIARNDQGLNKATAEESLRAKRYTDLETLAWYQGRYPAGTTAKAVAIKTMEERNRFLVGIRLPAGDGQPMLPLGRLELRARRFAVKRFLQHYWEVTYHVTYGMMAPLPYILAKQPELHTRYIAPPPGENGLPYDPAKLKPRPAGLDMYPSQWRKPGDEDGKGTG